MLVLVVCASVTLAAQDRVILFDTWLAGPFLKWQARIRELEITDGGRRWQLVRTLDLPQHIASSPVALADGSRIFWLTTDGLATTPIGLAQYDLRTGRASFVDVGPLHGGTLLADKRKLRLYIVGEDRITFIDERLRPETMSLAGVGGLGGAVRIVDDYLVLQRRGSGSSREGQLLFVHLETRHVARMIPFRNWAFHWRVSRDGERIYSAYTDAFAGVAIELISGNSGALLKRVVLDFPGVRDVLYLDDARNALVHDNGGGLLVVRDATTLAIIGELGPGVFHGRNNRGRERYQIQQTITEKAILVFSEDKWWWGDAGSCDSNPRVDIFEGTTLRHVNRINLTMTCPVLLAVPPR